MNRFSPVVLAFATLPWTMQACGRAANVLEGDPGDLGTVFPDASSGAGGFAPMTGTGGAGGAEPVTGAGGGPAGGASGQVIGPGGAYEWGLEGDECRVTGGMNGSRNIVASCLAGIDGAQSCTCEVSGAPLDRVEGNPRVLRTADCLSVATEFASGFCSNALDCCFEHEATGAPRCDCMDPSPEGFADCAALIAHYGGQRAPNDCPRYQDGP